jgi:hypothetical protein
VFDVSSMTRTELKKDAFNRITMDGMRWSLNKIKAIRAGMIKGEHFLNYVFPILRFHSRWNDLTADDFRYLFSRPSVSYNGYYLRADVKTTTTYPPDHKQKNMTFNAVNAEYLKKIADLCREKNVTLILIKSPSRYPAWYDEWDSQISDFASANGIRYFNFAKVKDEIGIDYETDTYDGGLHLNVSGAEKVADYFGNILSSEYGLTDHRSDSAVKAYWEEMTERYESERKAQEAEFAELGYVSRYRNTDTENADPGRQQCRRGQQVRDFLVTENRQHPSKLRSLRLLCVSRVLLFSAEKKDENQLCTLQILSRFGICGFLCGKRLKTCCVSAGLKLVSGAE